GFVGDLPQRPHLDTRRAHVDDEIRDATLLRCLEVGAGETDAPVRELGIARPYLLAVHHPAALDRVGARGHRREVAAGAGLAEQLAPQLARREDVRQPALLLRRRAAGEQRRTDEVHADPTDQLGRPGARELLGHDEVLDRAGAAPAVL